MKKTILFLYIIIALAIAALPLTAIEIEVHGTADTVFASSVWGKADILAARVGFKPKLEFFADNFYARASVKAKYNALDPKKIDFSLGEVFAECNWNAFDFRIGRQIIAWGKADGFDLTDVICPKDYSEFIGIEYKDARKPVNGILLRHFGSIYSIEGIWIPVFVPSYPTLENQLSPVFFPPFEVEIMGNKYKSKYTINEKKAPLSIKDGEWALRASFFLPAIDFSFSVFRGWDHSPNFNYKIEPLSPPSVPKLVLTPSFNRIWMAGMDMAIPIDMFIIRMETAYSGKREFMAKGLLLPVLSKHHQLKALVGLECNPGAGWMINAQYMEDVVFENTEKLMRSQRLPMISLFVSKTLLREKMKISGSLLIGCDAWDTRSALDISYNFVDDFKMTLGAAVFCRGKEQGVFGKMEEFSNIWLKGEFSF